MLDRPSITGCRRRSSNPRGRDPGKIALGETIVKIIGERFWLVAAVGSDTNIILQDRLHTSRNTAVAKLFLREIKQKHAIDEKFVVDGAAQLE